MILGLTFAAAGFARAHPLEFEVATIKPASMPSPADIAAGKIHVGMTVDAQRVDIGFLSLPELITIAYKLKRYQIVVPDWMASQRFDVQAKLPEGASSEQVPEMLQALLAERFKLVVHRDSKEHNVYGLVVGKGGPKLKEAAPDPEGAKDGDSAAANQSNGVRMSRDSKGFMVSGGRGGAVRVQMQAGGMHYEFAKMSMSGLADMLSTFLDRPVIDMTELKGNFQLSLDLTLEDMRGAMKAAGVAIPAGGPLGGGRGPDAGKIPADAASDPAGSKLFQSVQELGLKLESRKAPVETIVVDHCEKTPTEN